MAIQPLFIFRLLRAVVFISEVAIVKCVEDRASGEVAVELELKGVIEIGFNFAGPALPRRCSKEGKASKQLSVMRAAGKLISSAHSMFPESTALLTPAIEFS